MYYTYSMYICITIATHYISYPNTHTCYNRKTLCWWFYRFYNSPPRFLQVSLATYSFRGGKRSQKKHGTSGQVTPKNCPYLRRKLQSTPFPIVITRRVVKFAWEVQLRGLKVCDLFKACKSWLSRQILLEVVETVYNIAYNHLAAQRGA